MLNHLLERSDDVLTCHSPLEFSTEDGAGSITSLLQLPWKDRHVVRQRIALDGQPAIRVRVRHPHWADQVVARGAWGEALELESKDGWHTTKKAVTEVLFIYPAPSTQKTATAIACRVDPKKANRS